MRSQVFPQYNSLKFFSFLVMLFLGWGLASQQVQAQSASESEKVSIPFEADVGTKFTVTILKERKDTKDDKTTSHFKSKSTYAGTIDEVNEETMLITWQPTGFEVEQIITPTKIPPIDLETMAKEFNFPVQFEADLLGQPLKIVKRDEFQEKLLGLTQHLGGKVAEGITKILKDTFFKLPDEQFAKLFLQEAQVLAQGQTMEVPRTGVIESSDQVPSPLGGPPVTYVSKVRFVEETSKYAVFELIGEMEQESVRKNSAAIVEKMAKQTGKSLSEIQKAMGQLQIQRSDKVTYQVSKNNGWTDHVAVNKEITTSSQGKSQARTDTWDISVQMQ
jgi:hypothetical protein